VKIGERTLADNEVPLLEETKDKVISPSTQPISLIDHTIEDELKANTGKKKRKVVFDAPFEEAEASSVPGDNAGTSTSVSGEGSPIDEFYESQTIDSATAQDTAARFRDTFNINSAQHVYMASELRLRDAEIAALKAKLKTAEKESVELIGLRGRVSKLETKVVAKSKDIAGLNK
nr:hypothetical protein [Tanacetum cinerariifolium]